MAYRDNTAERTTITRNLREMEDAVGNVYETIVVLSKCPRGRLERYSDSVYR